MLKLIGNDASVEIEDISEEVIKALVAQDKINIDNAYDKYYNSVTYKNLEDTNSGLYLKPWQDIYEMLKKELG